jgi:hypothetical protein
LFPERGLRGKGTKERKSRRVGREKKGNLERQRRKQKVFERKKIG